MSELSDVVGAVTGSAVAAVNPISALADLGKTLIDRFIPDPAKKAEAAELIATQQYDLQMAQIDAANKVVIAASANEQGANDHYLGTVRAGFCWMVIALMAWNWGIGPVCHYPPVAIPSFVIACFTSILLGFVGIPAGIEMAKQIAGMPGDSQVSLLGMKVGNKS